jgi:hypothetical protein
MRICPRLAATAVLKETTSILFARVIEDAFQLHLVRHLSSPPSVDCLDRVSGFRRLVHCAEVGTEEPILLLSRR